MEQNQIERFERNQDIIIDGIHKLLALFTLEPVNDATNPILNLKQAAELLNISPGHLSEACKNYEVPYRRLGSKYLFSRVALMAWLHNINMSYLFERIEAHKKYYKNNYGSNSPEVFLENWIRFTINPITGANEEFHLRFSEDSEVDESNFIDTFKAAELMQVSESKVREWARGFLYYKIPVIRTGNKLLFKLDELNEWMETAGFKKLRDDYIKNKSLNEERYKAAEAMREVERLEKEERKRQRMMKKLNQ